MDAVRGEKIEEGNVSSYGRPLYASLILGELAKQGIRASKA